MTCGKRTIRRTSAAAIQNSAMLNGLPFLHCLRPQYSCRNPTTKRPRAPTSSQGRAACNLTLAPANPTAPRKPKGKQQARVERAAITAATGVARSATLMRLHFPSPLTEPPEALPLMEYRCLFAHKRQARPRVFVSFGNTFSMRSRAAYRPRPAAIEFHTVRVWCRE